MIDRYDARTVDFDIEGAALADVAANTRRALAIAQLARAAADDGHPLRVWLTLPVSPAGLPARSGRARQHDAPERREAGAASTS